MTEEEATEAMQVAMTVGATRIQVMLANAQAEPVLPAGAAPASTAASPPSFRAAEVVPQAGGG